MSRLDELKKQYPQLNLSFFDILTRMDRSKSYKYLPLLCKLFSKRFDIKSLYSTSEAESTIKTNKQRLNNYHINTEGLSDKEAYALTYLTEYWAEELFETFNDFQNKIESSLIKNTDVTSYNTIEDIRSAISLSELLSIEKEMENQVIKEYEDDTWLAVRPLTFSSSAKYGSGTRWCTTSKKEKSYFESYWRRGSLVYFINKKTGYKFASFRNFSEYDKELSFWNAEDSRIDFMGIEIDDYMFGIVKRIINNEVTNKSLCSIDIIESVEKECVEQYSNKSATEVTAAILRAEEPINLRFTITPTNENTISEIQAGLDEPTEESGELTEMDESMFVE